MSCDVTPAGLSTSSKPSLAAVSITCLRRRFSNLGQQSFDARSSRDSLVLLELNLRRNAKSQRTCNSGADVRCAAGESLEGCLLLRIGSHHAHEYASVAEIRSDV